MRLKPSFASRLTNNSLTITGYTDTNGMVTIPGATNGLAVVGIGNSAFQNAFVLTNVIISSGVTNIGSYSFYNCTNLVGVTLPDTLTSIGIDAFIHARA